METKLTKPQQTLTLCAAFIVGTAYYLLGFNFYILSAFLIALLFLAIKRLIPSALAIICLAVFLLSIVYTDFRTPKPDILYRKAPEKLEMTGRIVSEPQPDIQNKTKFYFETEMGKTLVYIYDYKRKFDTLNIGDVIKVKGNVKHPYRATNPGQFDYSKYLKNKGIFTVTHVSYNNWELVEPPQSGRWFLARKLNEIRKNIISRHAENLKSPNLEILGGMVFGDHAVPAPKEIEDNFIKSGLLHLLAASGLNVGIIFGFWYFLASRARLPFHTNIITGMVLVGVYALMTGLPPSVTRAALMMEMLLFGKLLDRKADNLGILTVICALMLLYNPLMLSDVGFQLSFIVTFGLLLVARFINFWSGIVMIPIVAQIFAAPIQIFHFNTFAMYSVLANIVVIPFVSLISFAGFAGSIFSLIPIIGDFLCFIADKIAEPFIILLLFVSKFSAELPGSLIYLPGPGVPALLAFYAMVILAIFRKKQAFIALLVLILFLFQPDFKKNYLEFIVFDVGQGDATLISTPDNRHILVDTGPPGEYSPARTAIVPYLLDKEIRKLDAIVLTHPDSDHIGGTVDILKAVKVKTIFHNGVQDETQTYESIRNFISQKGHKTVEINGTKPIIAENNLTITAIRPENTDTKEDNEDSIMLYIHYKDFSALLMADCESDTLNLLSQTVKKPVRLLKIGHHGSEGSVDSEFLKYMSPAVSVISVGTKGYQWGHPHPDVVSLLEQFDSKVFRTDKDYAVRIWTDGQTTKFASYNKNPSFF